MRLSPAVRFFMRANVRPDRRISVHNGRGRAGCYRSIVILSGTRCGKTARGLGSELRPKTGFANEW